MGTAVAAAAAVAARAETAPYLKQVGMRIQRGIQSSSAKHIWHSPKIGKNALNSKRETKKVEAHFDERMCYNPYQCWWAFQLFLAQLWKKR